ncbi:chondroitinase-B domain-containing protein [Flammeovirga pectinis]|uniref:chondroitinase-B domain-containing protein n=1 Tax=Flammeovirga pectinis TaxID=2494373 RepID=UPI001476C7CE|nr:chondroitinase-B domain-containing protein [Flammeovirga pectinis]
MSSDEEFNDLVLQAGDVVIWTDGTYADQNLQFSGSIGTASNPILVKAETPGGVVFTGTSKVNFYGSYLILDGFYWKGGEGVSDHIEFRRNGSNTDFGTHCTIRNCAFDDLYTEAPNKSRWIVLHGENNVVENCSFINKKSAGACILVELSYAAGLNPSHVIRNNYFYNITPKDGFTTNSGDCEAIRIGVSSYQSVEANVLVEGNYFLEADGENEIITNKSAKNTFLHNTFRKCRGSLVLRHGAGAYIEGNFFLGEGKASSGGIRVSDSDHVIINNYMQGLSNSGDKWNNGITLVGGGESSGGSGNGYQNVDNIVIAHNTIYASDDPIFFNNRSSYDPVGVIAYNLIYSENGDIISGDIEGTGSGMQYEGNIFGGSAIGLANNGITSANVDFSADGTIFKPVSNSIFVDAAGSVYKDLVNIDIDGLTRPNNGLDVGAHEVDGGSGTKRYQPITNNQVGSEVGACFLDANGTLLASCGSVNDYIIVSNISSFSSEGETISASLTSNVAWTIEEDVNWISITPQSGAGNSTIEITANENSSTEERTGSIVVKGEGVDNQTIVLTQNGYVAPVSVTGVSVTPASSLLVLGGILQLNASILPTDASNTAVSFSSTNTQVITVNATGEVMATGEGVATITVTSDDGNFTDTAEIEVVAPSSDDNLALNKAISSTGTVDGTNVASNLIDGDVASRWSVNGYPQSATIDLGSDFTIDRTELICYSDRDYQFTVEVANEEGGPYVQVVDKTDNTVPGAVDAPIIATFQSVSARYVRLTVTGAATYSGSWISINELRIFGEEDEVDVISVTGVSLTPQVSSLIEGDELQLTAEVLPLNADNTSITFNSSNSSIATVNSSGKVIALNAGSVTISVITEDGNFSASSEIEVTAPTTDNNENLALNKAISSSSTADGTNVAANLVDGDVASRWSVANFPQSATIDLGGDFAIESTALVCYNDRDYQFTIEVATEENGPYVEVVDQTDNTLSGAVDAPIVNTFQSVTARFVKITVTGAATYTGTWVSLTELSVFGEAQDTENPSIAVTGVTLTTQNSTLEVENEVQLTAEVLPLNADNKAITYSTSNSSVATVSSSGNVTAVGSGTATISVTTVDGNYTDTIDIEVTSPVSEEVFNVALNKAIVGTGTADGDNSPLNLVDGDDISRWSVSGFPQSATIDLGGNFDIESTALVCHKDRDYQFTIEVANQENGPYIEVVDQTENTLAGTVDAPIENYFEPITARFVKITVTGAATYTGTWVSLGELNVFGAAASSSSARVASVSQDLEDVSLIQNVYPNPSVGNVNIDFTSKVEYKIYNMTGQVVRSGDASELKVNLAKGAYVLVATDENGNRDLAKLICR